MKKRIVLTDIALITPLGSTVQTTWNSLENSISGFSPVVPSEIRGINIHCAGKIKNGEKSDQKNNHRWLFLFDQLKSQLDISTNNNIFYSIGTVFAGIHGYSFSPLNREHIAGAAGCPEENILIHTNTCAAGNFAIQSGINLIRSGVAEKVICGGIDILSPYLFAGFTALRSLAKGPCLPFSPNREGLSLGEGGALIVLQSLDGARDEGRRIICEYGGFGTSCDTKGITGMDKSGRGICACISAALENSHIKKEQVDLISAHGTGTRLNDEVEARALEKLFGCRPFIQAFKSYWGHCMGASSAIEAALLALTFQKETLIRIGHNDPFEYDLNFLQENRPYTIEYGLNTAYGFGGVNSCLVLKRYHD